MIRNLALVVGLVGGVALAEAQTRGQAPARRPQVPQTLRVLNQRLPEIEFAETPFEQVMDWLTDFTKLNVSVRWQILEDSGVARDTPISIQARNLRLAQVLWLIMNEAGGTDIKLAYRASGNLLVLSTEEDLGREMVTKIYDVSDLLVRLPRATRQSAFDVTQGMGQGGQGGGGGGGGGSGMFGQNQGNQQQNNQDYDQQGTGNEAQMEQLLDLIRSTVEPDTWRENGGLGTIMPYQRSIIVRNTILVHQKLGGYVTENDLVGP